MKLKSSKIFYINFIDNIILLYTYDNENKIFIRSYSMIVSEKGCSMVIKFCVN